MLAALLFIREPKAKSQDASDAHVRISPDSDFLSGDLKLQIESHLRYCNHERLSNVTPADVYFRRAQSIVKGRKKTVEEIVIEHRRLQYCEAAAFCQPNR